MSTTCQKEIVAKDKTIFLEFKQEFCISFVYVLVNAVLFINIPFPFIFIFSCLYLKII
ncbi:hypothetical protein B11515_06080 [Campylobacter jejuni]|nr:hypothetical protein B11515_06080 [Campylobacter jejuni]